MNWKKTRQIWPNLSRVSFPISVTFFCFLFFTMCEIAIIGMSVYFNQTTESTTF